jgi:hypothetical protein
LSNLNVIGRERLFGCGHGLWHLLYNYGRVRRETIIVDVPAHALSLFSIWSWSPFCGIPREIRRKKIKVKSERITIQEDDKPQRAL